MGFDTQFILPLIYGKVWVIKTKWRIRDKDSFYKLLKVDLTLFYFFLTWIFLRKFLFLVNEFNFLIFGFLNDTISKITVTKNFCPFHYYLTFCFHLIWYRNKSCQLSYCLNYVFVVWTRTVTGSSCWKVIDGVLIVRKTFRGNMTNQDNSYHSKYRLYDRKNKSNKS